MKVTLQLVLLGNYAKTKISGADLLFLKKYHSGYQAQMSQWPQQPVNEIMRWLQAHSPLVVTDFGCGDTRLVKSAQNKVFSLDLVSNDPDVIVCDMSNISLDSACIDVAVFFLSLMGTNNQNYLIEAHRVLKPGSEEQNGSKNWRSRPRNVRNLGFTLALKDFSKKNVRTVAFQQKGDGKNSKRKDIDWPELKPCIYKRQ